MTDPLLDVRNLTVSFTTDEGVITAVEDASFRVGKGEILGLVGESGCGKSVTSLAVVRLIPVPPGNIESGQAIFKGRDLLELEPGDMRDIRGNEISMIFQEPMAALSPLQRVGQQLVEALQLHDEGLSNKEAWKIAQNWLEQVRIKDAAERMYAYPYQLSGGQQQRVMIAMAMMQNPDLIIADEPTTALDVTIQAQVFKLIREMRQEKTAILLITHDMGVIWEMCDRVMVMYASRIVEKGTKAELFASPAHPYTRGLLASIPRLAKKTGKLYSIPGQVPSPFHYPSGCHFRDRCQHAFDRCAQEEPQLMELSGSHRAACFIADKLVKEPADLG
jgi:peptide/nickel transport system ATP-binding protein/oligopeptide transport system ATP-binding protein